MNSKQVLENLGLKVIDDQPYDYSAIQGKKCYGQLWENPQFTDFEGFARTPELAPTALRIKPSQAGIDFRGREHVVVDGKYVQTVTEKFQLIQHKEILMNAVAAAQQIGLKPVGSVRHNAGRMDGHVVFTGAQESVQILKDTGENLAVGARFFNSYAGDRGVGVDAFAIRAICCNYNAWGEDLGSVYATHSKSTAVEEIEAAFQKMIDAATKLPKVIRDAQEAEVQLEDVPDLLWAVRFPEPYIMGSKRVTNALVPNIEKWEPSILENGLNRWTLSQAAQAVLTHGVALNAGAVEYHSAKLAPLLSGNYDDLVAAGRVRRLDVQERRAILLAKKLAGSKAAEADLEDDSEE